MPPPPHESLVWERGQETRMLARAQTQHTRVQNDWYRRSRAKPFALLIKDLEDAARLPVQNIQDVARGQKSADRTAAAAKRRLQTAAIDAFRIAAAADDVMHAAEQTYGNDRALASLDREAAIARETQEWGSERESERGRRAGRGRQAPQRRRPPALCQQRHGHPRRVGLDRRQWNRDS